MAMVVKNNMSSLRTLKALNQNWQPVNEQAEIYETVEFLLKNGYDREKILQALSSATDREKTFAVAAVNILSDSRPFINAAQRMAAYDNLCAELSQLNTMRGGVKGFKGFVGEHMQAANATAGGKFTRVLDNNGPIDLIFEGKNGRAYPQQLKIGYKPGQIKFKNYKGQTVIVDKGNPHLRELQAEGARHGVKVIEGTVTEAEAKWWADAMQFETKITGNKTSVLVPEIQNVANNLSAMHEAGLKVGKTGAMYGAGFSIGKNIVGMMRGDVTVGEAAVNVACDTAVSYGVGYASGAVGSGVARTAAGKAIGSALGSATAATAGTAVGGAVATGVAGASAAGAAIGAAAIAAAPVVAVGAVIGGIFSLFFDD